jgi:hypothetical protein
MFLIPSIDRDPLYQGEIDVSDLVIVDADLVPGQFIFEVLHMFYLDGTVGLFCTQKPICLQSGK